MLLNTGGKAPKLPANMSYLDILNNKVKLFFYVFMFYFICCSVIK